MHILLLLACLIIVIRFGVPMACVLFYWLFSGETAFSRFFIVCTKIALVCTVIFFIAVINQITTHH